MGQAEAGGVAPARPFVAGSLGPASPTLVARLRELSPVAVEPVVTEPGITVIASPGLECWTAGARRGWHWGRAALDGTPTCWQDASRSLMAAGIAIGPDGVHVHADALALHDVFVRELAGAVYFATTMGPLLGLSGEPLHPDWEGWSTCLVFGSPIDHLTTVQEIRRLRHGEVVHLDRDGALVQVRDQPFWDRPPTAPPTPARIADLMVSGVPEGRGLLDLPLTGGWDSRTIALAAARKGRRLRTWTTYQHRLWDRDIEYAAAVAQALGSRHRHHLPERVAWKRRLSRVWRRVEHQTWMHGWFEDFAHRLRKRGRPVMDGLFGDVLFRADVAARGAVTPGPWAHVTFGLLGAKRAHWVAPDLHDALVAASYGAFEALATPLEGHPNMRTAVQLVSRANRPIGSAPRLFLGPELRVHVPFAQPEVLASSLTIPLAEKVDGAFYRRLLDTLDPEIARLPTTNDHPQRRVNPAYQRPQLRYLSETIRGSELALRLLSPRLRQTVQDPERIRDLQRGTRATSILSWAALLADFERTHGSRLDWSRWPG